MSRPLPECVQQALQVIGENPRMAGLALEAVETQPGLWEITATMKCCIYCATPIGTPTGEHTIVNPGTTYDPSLPTVMPHICAGCADHIRMHNEGTHQTRPKEAN